MVSGAIPTHGCKDACYELELRTLLRERSVIREVVMRQSSVRLNLPIESVHVGAALAQRAARSSGQSGDIRGQSSLSHLTPAEILVHPAVIPGRGTITDRGMPRAI